MKNCKRLGKILLDDKYINQEQMQEALRIQAITRDRLGHIFVSMGIISEEELVGTLSKRLGVPIFNPEKIAISEDLLELFPVSFLSENNIVPIERSGKKIVIAMVDPLDFAVIRDIEFMFGVVVQPMIANQLDIKYLLEKKFVGNFDVKDIIKKIKTPEIIEIIEEKNEYSEDKIAQLEQIGQAAPIVKLVNKILAGSVTLGASDIHIEPRQNEVVIRNRIDGLLQTIKRLPFHLRPSILSRLKIMAKMDIAENRRPQDGCAKIKVGNKKIDLRISTLPTYHGEKMVIRILDKSQKLINLEELGMLNPIRKLFCDLILRPQGMILVTGPTGSGKTTTLYSGLNFIYSEGVNIITIEDPIEYNIPGVNQIQVNEKVGITFSSGLRSIVRQDPNIIMVGEIRDCEAAAISFQASLTGHQVFSTLHTNNAVSSITRLLNIGIEPYLLSSSLVGVVAQRLIRRNCPHCLVPYTPEPVILERLNIASWEKKEIRFYRGEGCRKCNFIGYSGRIGIFELLKIDDIIKNLITEGAAEKEIFLNARKSGFTTMEENGLYLVLKKLTTLDEIFRVIPSEEISSNKKDEWMEKIQYLFMEDYFADYSN